MDTADTVEVLLVEKTKVVLLLSCGERKIGAVMSAKESRRVASRLGKGANDAASAEARAKS